MNSSKRKYAIIAGISLLTMAAAAAFSYGFVYSDLFIHGNPLKTLQNVSNSSSLFLAGIAGWSIIFISDIAVALALYHFFKNENKTISMVTALIRLLYTLFLGIATSHLIQISSTVGNLNEFTNSLATNMMFHFAKFEKKWSLGLIIFGIHLIGLGYLAIRNFAVPKFWGWFLILAGISYSVIHLAKNVMPDYITPIEIVEMILSVPMAIAEIGFAVWLLARGGKAVKIKVR